MPRCWFWRETAAVTREDLDPYDPSSQPEPAESDLIDLLSARNGVRTVVKLRCGAQHEVWDIAWGYDALNDQPHVTTNVSPGVPDRPLDVFTTDEVLTVLDPDSGQTIWPGDHSAP